MERDLVFYGNRGNQNLGGKGKFQEGNGGGENLGFWHNLESGDERKYSQRSFK